MEGEALTEIHQITAKPYIGRKLQGDVDLLAHIQRHLEFAELTQVRLGHRVLGLDVRRAPAGAHEPDTQLVPPTLSTPGVTPELRIKLQVGPQRVPAGQGCGHTENQRFVIVFLLEGTEQSVPNNEHPAVVAIHVESVLRMVGPMIGRCDEKPFEPAKLGNMACMDPELIQQVERRHADKHHQWHTNHRQGQVEDPAQQETGAGLAQSGAEVVVLALVMHRMRGPQYVALMTHAVQPVVAEVIEHKGKHPGPGTLGRQFEQRQVLDGERVGQQAHALGEQACGGGQHPVLRLLMASATR